MCKPPTLRTVVTVACFKLTTEQDYLCHYLNRTGVVESSECISYREAEMTADI